MESVLIVTGSMGAGKTSVMGEASDLLAQRQIVHAAIDLDALGVGRNPSGSHRILMDFDQIRLI